MYICMSNHGSLLCCHDPTKSSQSRPRATTLRQRCDDCVRNCDDFLTTCDYFGRVCDDFTNTSDDSAICLRRLRDDFETTCEGIVATSVPDGKGRLRDDRDKASEYLARVEARMQRKLLCPAPTYHCSFIDRLMDLQDLTEHMRNRFDVLRRKREQEDSESEHQESERIVGNQNCANVESYADD